MVSNLAVNLLAEETTLHTISLVAETEGAIVDHVAFGPVTTGNNEDLQGYILAPLGVKPDYQKRRIGSELVESGMQQLRVGSELVVTLFLPCTALPEMVVLTYE
jgi:putative acetyltransferase